MNQTGIYDRFGASWMHDLHAYKGINEQTKKLTHTSASIMTSITQYETPNLISNTTTYDLI